MMFVYASLCSPVCCHLVCVVRPIRSHDQWIKPIECLVVSGDADQNLVISLTSISAP